MSASSRIKPSRVSLASPMVLYCFNFHREAAQKVFFLMDSPLRPLAPSRLSGQKKFCLYFFLPETDFDNSFSPQFLDLKSYIVLSKYFKKPVKYCEFSDRQLIHNTYSNTLILIFGYVVLNKIYLIFQRRQIKKNIKKSSFFLNGQPLIPPPS